MEKHGLWYGDYNNGSKVDNFFVDVGGVMKPWDVIKNAPLNVESVSTDASLGFLHNLKYGTTSHEVFDVISKARTIANKG